MKNTTQPEPSKGTEMKLNVLKLGWAFGFTFALIYFGCAMVMFATGHDGTVRFFNSLFHGFEFSSIIRMDISPTEELLGIAQIFVIAWVVGASIAGIYNATLKTN